MTDVLITGGRGFVGSHIVSELKSRGIHDIAISHSGMYDLRDWSDTVALFEYVKPKRVIHAAARVGGIEANRTNPAQFFYDNVMMGIHVIQAAHQFKVKKILIIGTTCSYPKHCRVPFQETDLWQGYPEETNAPYGLAKRILLTMVQSYHAQYGLNAIYAIPTNLYGERDSFEVGTSHVIPAIIRKMLKESRSVELWGDGTATRDFLHVDDAARGLVDMLECYTGIAPLNLGSNREISISDLAMLIATYSDYSGEIIWNSDYPNGQPRRLLDTTCAKASIGWQPSISLEDGLQRTIEWYRSHAQ